MKAFITIDAATDTSTVSVASVSDMALSIDDMITKLDKISELSSSNAGSVEEIAFVVEHLHMPADKLNTQTA